MSRILQQCLSRVHAPNHGRVVGGGRAQDGQSHPRDADLPDAILVARVPPHRRALQGLALQVGHKAVGLGAEAIRVGPQLVGVHALAAAATGGAELDVIFAGGNGRVCVPELDEISLSF